MTASALTDTAPPPWYRQFWPWFIIAIPASSVVVGLTLLTISIKGADQMVVDDYYKQGLAINENLALDHFASERGMGVAVRFDFGTGEVFVDALEGDYPWPDRLQLKLLHPMAEEFDQTLILRQSAGGYRADLDSLPRHRYYLRLSTVETPGYPSRWRLNGELDFNQTQDQTKVKVLQAK